MRLSIIVPVFNEEKTVGEILQRLAAVKLNRVEKEIVVVDDGSTDGTKKLLTAIAKQSQKKKRFKSFKVISHPENRGKGAAVRTGLAEASGDYVLIQDADLEYGPQDIPRLLKPIQENKAEVVYGSRFTGERRNMFFWHMVGNQLLSLLINLLYNTTLSDMEVGYKIINRRLLTGLHLTANRFDFEPEITVKLLKKGLKIYEVPISYAGRDYQEGKKITWKDGLKAVWVILRERF